MVSLTGDRCGFHVAGYGSKSKALRKTFVFSGNPQSSSPEEHTSPPCLLYSQLLQSSENKVPTQSVTTSNLLFIGMGFSMKLGYVAQAGLKLSCLGSAVQVCATMPCFANHCKGFSLKHACVCVPFALEGAPE